MKLIWLKTKELQSFKVDFSWQSIMGPLVIVSTSYHRKHLFLSRVQSIMGPLVIGSTSYHREYLLSSEAPLIIEKTSSYRECKASWDLLSSEALLSSRVPLIIGSTSSYRECKASWDVLSSEAPLIIESTSYHRKDLFLSRVQSIMGPLVIESTSCHREYLLSSERPLIIGDTSCYRKAFLSDRERHNSRHPFFTKLMSISVFRMVNSFPLYCRMIFEFESPILACINQQSWHASVSQKMDILPAEGLEN